MCLLISFWVQNEISTLQRGDVNTEQTDSTENATPPKSTEPRNLNSSVQIQKKPESQAEFVPRDTEKSEFLIWLILGV